MTGSAEQRYFKVNGGMEKKWDTGIPANLKRLFISGTYGICPTGHKRVKMHVTKLWNIIVFLP
jgi:hypothetical protein